MMKNAKHKRREKIGKHLHKKGQSKAYLREQNLLLEAGLLSNNSKKKENDNVQSKTIQSANSKQVGRHHTLSVALPGSILDNAQSPELRTYLAGQIARACVVFQVLFINNVWIAGDSSKMVYVFKEVHLVVPFLLWIALACVLGPKVLCRNQWRLPSR